MSTKRLPVEKAEPYTVDEVRAIWRKRLDKGTEVRPVDRLCMTVFWLVEGKALPAEKEKK